MPQITVNLRVVGLFFSQPVKVDYRQDLSIKDVMDAAVEQYPLFNTPTKAAGPNGLAYRFTSESGPGYAQPSVLAITSRFDGTYEEVGQNNAANPNGCTIGKKKRAKGLYSLQELVLDPIVVAWQYYVIQKDTNINKSKTKPGQGFTFFSDKLSENNGLGLEDGDTVIWRMVAIVRRPNAEDPEVTACKGANPGSAY